ncbi:MAG TPA: prolyl oligopeptidase family serine peptidase [Chitinivibrionales bacterium]|nr:prolyl oligopeptidase family serine peptidase [Chitinivibrionales bacterium]
MRHLLLAGVLLLFFCQWQVAMPPEAADQYARWFVAPSSALTDSLKSYKCFAAAQDSLAQVARKAHEGRCGVFTAILEDTFHSAYTLGWKTPAAIRRDTLYPLIVYLHGGTGTSKTTKGEIAYDMLSSLGDTFNLFLASPSANRETPWWSPGGMSRVLQTVRFMTLCYPVNPDKIFLAGVSDGATGCYLAANTVCAPFAGFIAVSGYGAMLYSFGIKLHPQNLMQRPILNINAGNDRIYPFAEVMKFVAWLENNGVPVEHREYPEENHGFDYREKEYGNLARLIRTWTRPEAQRSVSWTFVPGFPNVPPNCITWEIASGTEEPAIKAFWKDDTLQVSTKGLKSALLTFPQKQNAAIFVSVNGSRPKSVRPAAADAGLALAFALHQLLPQAAHQAAYRITVP